jgi:hypothetical protein
MLLSRRQMLAATALAGCKSSAPEPAPYTAPIPEARSVQGVIAPTSTVDGAGVHISRVIGGAALPMVDPFLLLDHIRSSDPSEFEPGFPRHPHRGFETVTIMLDGAIEHRDSMGNHGRLTGGSIQWMTAGHGIVHSEMPQRNGAGTQFWGLQLWVNLPKKLKMTAPRYQDLGSDRVPLVGNTRVLAGAHDKTNGPVEGIVVAPTILDISLAANEDFVHELPAAHSAVALVLSGTALVGAGRTVVPEKSVAVLGSGSVVALRGSNARVLLIAAAPIGEPVARRGPFVMSTEAELDQAWDDYRTGRLTQL